MFRRLGMLLIYSILIASCYGNAFAQSAEELFTTVVFIKGQYTKEIEINNDKYELWIKKIGDNKYMPSEIISGTGFFVQDTKGIYLVTAEHIARHLKYNVRIIVHGKGDIPLQFDLAQLTDYIDERNWFYHTEGDVAVLQIKPKLNLKEHIKTIPIDAFLRGKDTPDKNRIVTTIGFPLNLGTSGKFSPITKSSKIASGMFRFKRRDNQKFQDIFILEDTSVAGFSGAPVCALPEVHFGGASLGVGSFYCVGLVHGTLFDETGGKFAAIVPSKYILEAITDSLNINK